MKPIHNLKQRFSSMNYMKKLFFSYLLIMCMILIIFSFVSSYYSSKSETKQALYTAKNMLLQTTEFLGYKVTSIKNIINVISADETIQTVISSSEEYDREYQNNWMILTTTAKSIMYNANTSKDIHNIRLYPLEGSASFENSREFGQLTEGEKAAWFRRSGEKENVNYLWLPSTFFSSSKSLGAITYVKKIPDSKNLNQYLGMLTATVNDSAFQDVIAQAATTLHTSVLLYNSYGETIMYHGKEDFFSPEDIEALHLQAASASDSELQRIRFKGGSYFIGIQPIDGCDWTLAILTPSSDILSATRRYQQQTLLLVLLLLAFLIPVLYRTSKSLSSRIYILKEYISQAVGANFEVEPLENGSDEIGVLTDSFNDMVKQITGLLKEQYKLGYEIKDLEFQVLQSQINPHFLYNTLDMIYWLGVDNHAPDVADAARELGRFYMLSLGHGETIVSLKNELDHVAAYVNIQNMRFEDHFKLTIDVPETLYDYKIIKIILQPLVENAILHGIREKSSETGEITIAAGLKDGVITISITDDGVGIPEEKLETLLTKSTKNSGYGVWNIHERIQLSYGNQYGLRYTSRPYIGTTVFITFPAILQE